MSGLRADIVNFSIRVLVSMPKYILGRRPAMEETSLQDGWGQVVFMPGLVFHWRLKPIEYQFMFPYLTVGIPVGREGDVAGILSVGSTGDARSWWQSIRNRFVNKSWFHVDARNYLARGRGELGLRGKLDLFLRERGADPERYPFAYLVTAPEMFGYQFNPVSFWFLYNSDKHLLATILEVNNTFGERHMYFLTEENTELSPTNLSSLFIQHFPKEFHVSPFNPRKGKYELNGCDPLWNSKGAEGVGLFMSISLHPSDPEDQTKLFTRVSCEERETIDPLTMSEREKFNFLLSWWWTGFLTIPRILRGAWDLYAQLGLPVWYKPEPLKGTLCREATSTERKLEAIFRRYLRHFVEHAPEAIKVRYVSGGITPHNEQEREEDVMFSRAARTRQAASGNPGVIQEVEFRVLDPSFYTRVLGYEDTFAALVLELDSQTIWVSDPELLGYHAAVANGPQQISCRCCAPFTAGPTTSYPRLSWRERMCLMLIRRLRDEPERIVRPMTDVQARVEGSKISKSGRNILDRVCGSHPSEMDEYVLRCELSQSRASYLFYAVGTLVNNRLVFFLFAIFYAIVWLLEMCVKWLPQVTRKVVWRVSNWQERVVFVVSRLKAAEP